MKMHGNSAILASELKSRMNHDTDTESRAGKVRASRIDWVDHAKGFCIIFVVMMHSTLGVELAAGETGWMGHVVAFAQPFRMPDFFLISGLFLALVINRPWLRYFDRKVVHFFYFYVLWMTIQFAFKAPAWMGEGREMGEIIQLYFNSFVQPFGTLWFIYILPIFFVLTRLVKDVSPWLLLIGAALLEILPVETGILLVDEFAARYVYFLAGYLLAPRLFDLAAWAERNVVVSITGLLAWCVGNGILVFAPVPFSGLSVLGHELPDQWSMMPLVSFALGAAGASAVVVLSALLSRIRWSGFLAFLGANSIAVYLAFFLPMAVSRIILLKFAPFLDVGTVSLIVTMAGVTGPVVLLFVIRWTGLGKFLFTRPQWAIIDKPVSTKTDGNKATDPLRNPRASAQPAE